MLFTAWDDHRFVDRIATRIFALERDSEATFVEGRLSEHESCRRHQFNEAATRPIRLRTGDLRGKEGEMVIPGTYLPAQGRSRVYGYLLAR